MTADRKRVRAPGGQYEPLHTPQKWTDDEKRFAIRVTQLMDELFQRQSAMQRRLAALEKQGKEQNNGSI